MLMILGGAEREIAGNESPPMEIWRRIHFSRKDAQALFAEPTSAVHRYESLATLSGIGLDPSLGSW